MHTISIDYAYVTGILYAGGDMVCELHLIFLSLF